MKFLKKETGKSDPRVAILGNVVPGVVLQMKKIAATAKAEGIDVVYSEAMSGTDSSVATYTAGILAAKPDAVWFDIFAPFTGPLVSGIRGAGLKSIPIETVVAGVNYAQLAATADPHLFVTTGANYVFPGKSSSSPELKTLLKALAQAGLTSVASINTGAGPTQLAADLAVLNALKVCGPSCTGAELHKKLLTTTFSFPGLVEGFKFEVNRHDGFNSLKFWSWDAASGAAKLRSTLPVGSSSPTSP
jgi:ABC-type branched-subunit amino acid transport system substrate-binding protein